MIEEIFEQFINNDYYTLNNDYGECGGISIWSIGNPYKSWSQSQRCIFVIGNKVYINLNMNYSGDIIDRANENAMFQYIKEKGYKLYAYSENWYYSFPKQIEDSVEKDIDLLIKYNTK